jgi:hypothetical protein
MNETPAFAPWYKSAVVKGLAIIFSTIILKIIALVLKKYQIDLDLSALGLTPDTLADFIIVTVIPGAVGYALHGRVAKGLPTLTLTKGAADTANAIAAGAPPANSIQPEPPANQEIPK